jgi:hypothetical protein
VEAWSRIADARAGSRLIGTIGQGRIENERTGGAGARTDGTRFERVRECRRWRKNGTRERSAEVKSERASCETVRERERYRVWRYEWIRSISIISNDPSYM